MPENSADEKQGHLAQAGVTISGEERFPVLPKRHVGVHPGAVVAEEWFGHEGHALVVLLRHVPDDVFVVLHPVAHLLHRSETDVDLGLARGCDFVMLALNRDAGLLQLQTHLVANILEAVRRPDREITFFRANLVTEIWELFPRAIPMPFGTIDQME